MLYCGSVYDELLHRCHSVIETSSQPDVQSSSVDADDVYYRFDGHIKHVAQYVCLNKSLCIIWQTATISRNICVTET